MAAAACGEEEKGDAASGEEEKGDASRGEEEAAAVTRLVEAMAVDARREEETGPPCDDGAPSFDAPCVERCGLEQDGQPPAICWWPDGVGKFPAAYAHRIPVLTDISQWPKDTHDFYLYPPMLRRSAGRQKKQRFKGGLEGRGRNGQHKCPLCLGYGHRWNKCKQADPEAKEAYALLPKKRPKKKKAVSTSQFVPIGDASSSVSAVQVSFMALVPLVPIAEVSTTKKRCKKKSREPASPDSPAMGTRSKKRVISPSVNTSSKRKLMS